MVYIFQVTVYSALFYTVYRLLLHNRLNHGISRSYLLVCAILPLFLPLIKIDGGANVLPERFSKVVLPAITVGASKVASAPTISSLLMTVYLLVSVALILNMLMGYLKMSRLKRRGEIKDIGGIKIVTNTQIGPGSWGRYIFFPEENADELVLKHEIAHVKLKHSADIVVLHLLQCFFWPNLVLFFILKELKMVHEFQADALAAKGEQAYSEILLGHVFNVQQFPFVQTFFHHPIKRRIMILNKSGRSRSKVRGFAALVVSVGISGGIALAQGHKGELKPGSGRKVSNMSQVVDKPDKMPAFDGDLNGFLASHLHYPQEAKMSNKQGRVMLRFIVDASGAVVKPEIVNSPDTSLSTAALDVFKEMPKWKPGQKDGKNVAVYFYLPILFKI